MRPRHLVAVATAVAAVWFATTPLRVQQEATPDVDLVPVMEDCVGLQATAGTGDISEPAFLCMLDLARSALRAGRYPELLDAKEIYTKPYMWATCHAVGHSLGPELVSAGEDPAELFHTMFRVEQQQIDYFCAAALVHGIVDGMSQGASETDLPRIAEQCGVVNRYHNYYANECAHYLGHVVWDVHQEIGEEAAEACGLLDTFQVESGLESCMGGMVMEKFGLQDLSYGIEGAGQSEELPPLDQVTSVCSPLDDADRRVSEGCWGGVGWLLSMHLQSAMNDLDPRGDFADFPAALQDDAIRIHRDLMSECPSQNCLSTLMQHVRPQDWTNGIAAAVCAAGPIPGREELDLAFACSDITGGLLSG